MKHLYMNATVSVTWVLAICAIGFAAGITSTLGWVILLGLSLVPVVLLQRLRDRSRETLSESIQKALR
jgi:Flp pilus assembly protein TadB